LSSHNHQLRSLNELNTCLYSLNH